MTKIVLTAAAILIGMGTAFAGSDHYGSANANQPAVSIDNSHTASIRKSAVAVGNDSNAVNEPGQGIWGR